MNSNVLLEDTAYGLKRRGEFEKALLAYAKEYRRNIAQLTELQGSRYLARLCFEQMVDIILLKYLRDQRRFDNSRSLLDALEHEMRRVFEEMDIRDVEGGFEEFFSASRRKLFPRGRGKSAFSVDRNQLLGSAEYQTEGVPEYVREDRTDYTV